MSLEEVGALILRNGEGIHPCDDLLHLHRILALIDCYSQGLITGRKVAVGQKIELLKELAHSPE